MSKMKRKKLSLAVRNALNAGVAVGLAAPLAYGQDATTQAPPRIEKIEVTGSRIPISPNITSVSPISQITAGDIAIQGLTSADEIIDRLPQAYAGQNATVSNGSTGTASVNLRNLGSARTLVLIDGRRLPAGSPLIWAPDLNNIPAPLIQRVEVLTGGASAIYGSDAVAGVVNFIMNDHFEGVQFQYNGSGWNHQQHNGIVSAVQAAAATNPAQVTVPGDVGLTGIINDYNMLLGSNFANGKGNATVYFEYRHQAPVLQNQYDYSACALAATQSGSNPQLCSGSSTAYPGRFLNNNTGKSFTILDAAGNVGPYSTATGSFNFGPYNYYQTDNERYLANVFAHYDVFPNARVYAEFDFSDVSTTAQIAPSGIFFGNEFSLNYNNPLLSQSFKTAFGITPTTPGDVIIGRRNFEGGGRQADIRNTDYRYVLGVKGDFLDHKWDYDFWWQNGKTVYQQTYLNDFSNTRTQRALNVVTDPNTGKPVCQSVLNGTDLQCVPYDIFHIGGVTQAALNYVSVPGLQNGYTDQSVVGLHITSDLGDAYGWKSPYAVDGVGLAFGIERRVEKLSRTTDQEFSTGDLSGQGGATIGLSGQYTVVEPFVEVRVPLIEEKPWAYLLNVSGSYRYSNYYSLNQTTNSFGLGAQWAPVKGYMLRGSYQQAVRAPNVIELFTAQGFNLFSFSHDPCGPTGTATLAQCLRTGLQASQYKAAILDNPAGQGNFLQGGNPNLFPETSKSYTVGFVLTPLPKFNASLDYWNIKVDNAVGIIPSNLALSQCVAVGQFCNLIHRDANGTLWLSGGGYITGTNINIGQYKTDGWDVAVNYVWDLPKDWGTWGSLYFYFIGTYVNQFLTTPVPGLGTYDCAGLFGTVCGQPQPRWRNTFRTTWATPWTWDLALTWRYWGEASLDATSGNPQLSASYSTVDAKVPARNYIDLAASWYINKNWTLRFGVNNIFDKDPPIISNTIAGPASFGNGNTYPGIYDCCGRQLFVNVNAKF